MSMEDNMQMGKGGRERTSSDRMPCVVYKHICSDRGLLSPAPLLFGFLMCSCPCPVLSLSKLYLPLRQPRLFDLSKFIPILSAVCFSAFPEFFPSRSMACQILETTMGSRVFGGRYYDATAASSGLHGVAVLGHSQQFRIFAAPR